MVDRKMAEQLADRLAGWNARYDKYIDLAPALNETIAFLRALAAAQDAPADDARRNYVHRVPEHCDRITWRGRYYNLPIMFRLEGAASPAPEHAQRADPPPGLLVSIAMRLDHSFGIKMSFETEEQWRNRQRQLLSDARRCWEEVTGRGFYKPEREEEYASTAQRAEVEHAQDSAQQNPKGAFPQHPVEQLQGRAFTEARGAEAKTSSNVDVTSRERPAFQSQPSAPASERERFERTMKDWFPLVRERDEYEDTYATMAWVAWCARAALAAGDQQS